jgi:hypothetical protein
VLRPFDATSRSPLWVGAAYTLLYLVIYFAYHNLTGSMRGFELTVRPFWMEGPYEPRPLWEIPGWWSALVNAVVVGAIPTIGAYLRHGAQRDLWDLRPVLRGSPADFDALVAETISTPITHLRVAGVVGLCWGLSIPLLDSGIYGEITSESFRDPIFYWAVARHMLFGWLGIRALVAEVALTRAYVRIGETHTEIDLLEPDRLAPFARKGLRSTLLWVILTSIVSLFWLGPAPGRGNAIIVAVVLSLVTAAFVLPVRGVHHRIRASKRAELERVTEAIRRERDQLLGTREVAKPGELQEAPANQDARLASLIAYRGLIEEVREWPYDVSTLLRFVLVVSLALGSWLGGAIVERLLDTAIR